MRITHATLADLDAIAVLEAECFPPAEACPRATFEARIRAYPECFVLIRDEAGTLVSLVDGVTVKERDLTDAIYASTATYVPGGPWLMVMGVDTHPEHRGRGLATEALRTLLKEHRERGGRGAVLTCKRELLGFYARLGFVNEGVSSSEHGGAVWYQMRLEPV